MTCVVLIFGLISVISAAQGALPFSFGKCLYPIPVNNFQTEEFFNGSWYQQESYGNAIFEIGTACPTLTSRIDDGTIFIKTYNFHPRSNTWVIQHGQAQVSDIRKGLAYFDITFDVLGGLFNVKLPFYIVSTDYSNYAVVYSCKESFLLIKTELLFVVTRNKSAVTNATNSDIESALKLARLDSLPLTQANNDDCPPLGPI